MQLLLLVLHHHLLSEHFQIILNTRLKDASLMSKDSIQIKVPRRIPSPRDRLW
eukprot:c5295_g1_i1 orf=90-248(+)